MEEQFKMCVMRSDREDDGDENDITDLLKIENQMEKGTYKNRCEMMKVTNDKQTVNRMLVAFSEERQAI
ncbi:unnamed protein product [Brugia timori]|uniref:Bm9198 n=2 Tax=Brugia TaxID=6278 RepID=A0A0J9XQ23_BRUMA|nr:Bm9198 [Brugia malayi]VDO33751.1 unnamed protein product [Brugia timori]